MTSRGGVAAEPVYGVRDVGRGRAGSGGEVRLLMDYGGGRRRRRERVSDGSDSSGMTGRKNGVKRGGREISHSNNKTVQTECGPSARNSPADQSGSRRQAYGRAADRGLRVGKKTLRARAVLPSRTRRRVAPPSLFVSAAAVAAARR